MDKKMLTLLRFAFQTTLYFPNFVFIICNFPPPTPPKKLLPSTIPICQSSYQNRNVVLTRSLRDCIFFRHRLTALKLGNTDQIIERKLQSITLT